jgi:hypothetical protein
MLPVFMILFGRMVEEVKSSGIYLIHCKNLCKCQNVPPPSTIKEKKKGKREKKRDNAKQDSGTLVRKSK